MNKVSSLSNTDLRDLFRIINNQDMIYRNTLNSDLKKLTFGIELEFANLTKSDIAKLISKGRFALPLFAVERKQNMEDFWTYKEEFSIKGGAEIVSGILSDESKSWQEIKLMCRNIKNNGGIIDYRCASHFHIGAHIFGTKLEYWKTFLKLWLLYEPVLYHFYSNKDDKIRDNILKYAKSIRIKEVIEIINNTNSINNLIEPICLALLDNNENSCYKFYSLALHRIKYLKTRKEKGNTLEVRIPNGTLDEVVWQNNINLVVKIISSIINKEIDKDYINYQFKHNKLINDDSIYNEYNLEQALLFCDLVFQNDIDKYNFIKQYCKLYNNSDIELERKLIK